MRKRETYVARVREKFRKKPQTCRGCGETFEVLSGVPGRPRLYCSQRCRRDFYYQQERAEAFRKRLEEAARRRPAC